MHGDGSIQNVKGYRRSVYSLVRLVIDTTSYIRSLELGWSNGWSDRGLEEPRLTLESVITKATWRDGLSNPIETVGGQSDNYRTRRRLVRAQRLQ